MLLYLKCRIRTFNSKALHNNIIFVSGLLWKAMYNIKINYQPNKKHLKTKKSHPINFIGL